MCVFQVGIVVMDVLVYGKYECSVMQMYICVLCASCSSPQCCVLHDLQFVNATRGCRYGLCISWLDTCLCLAVMLMSSA